jgi:hypothetical protein
MSAGSLLLATLGGCAVIPGETQVPPDRQTDSRHHYYHVPDDPNLEGSHIVGVAKMNPKWWIGNSDDPLPWWWKPDAPLDERERTWMMRNPFHNFTHYVIGVSDRHTHRYGINARSIWNDEGPMNLSVTRSGPLLYLPMVSNRGRFFEWYFGWRESGNFGAAWRLAQHDSDGTGPRGRSPLSRAMAARARAEHAASQTDKQTPGAVRLPPLPVSSNAPPPTVDLLQGP